MAADVLDIISAADALAAINAATTPTELERMVTSVSRVIDDMCGPVVVRTITAEVHPGGRPSIMLRRWPVTSITTVREITAPGTITTLSAVAWGAASDGYYPVQSASTSSPTLLSRELRRVRQGYDVNWGLSPAYATWIDRAVEVTYVAGRYATTSVVDRRFAEACAAVLRRLWKRESGAWAQAASFFATDDESVAPTSGFFRAVKPIVEELLHDELAWSPGIA